MLKVDLHIHSICSDGLNTINEIYNFARRKQLKAIAITDHGPGLLPWHISRDYFYLLGRLIPKYKTKNPRVFLGIEANIINQHGKLDLPEGLLKNLDIIIAGLHPFPDTKYKFSKDNKKNALSVINAIRNVQVDCISHPYDYNYMDLSVIAETACKYKKLLELNEIHLGKRLDDGRFIREFKKAVKIIVENNWYFFCGSDGHDFCEIAQDYNIKRAIKIFKIPKKSIINNDYDKLGEFLRERQNERSSREVMRVGG